MIQRSEYISRIKSLLKTFPAVGIIGSRQVGKTTLVKEILKEISGEYLDLESDLDQIKLTDPGLYLRSREDRCVVLDEMHNNPELFPLLRSLIDENKQSGRFLLLGSASPDLLRKSAESLAGRIAYLELPPFRLNEVGKDNQEKLWIRGGLPLSYLSGSDNISLEWRRQFIRNYVDRDLPILGLTTDRRILRNFFRILAATTGQVWNASQMAKSLGVTAPTIRKYLDYADHTFLIRILEPFHRNVKKRLIKSPKVYFKDSGILHAFLNIPDMDALEGNPILGFSWEGFVVQQIAVRLKEDFEFYFYRTQDHAEIDLLLVKSGKPVTGIEIKYSNAPKLTKGLLNSIGDLKTAKNYIITPSSDHFPVHEKVDVISLNKFLETETKHFSGIDS